MAFLNQIEIYAIITQPHIELNMIRTIEQNIFCFRNVY